MTEGLRSKLAAEHAADLAGTGIALELFDGGDGTSFGLPFLDGVVMVGTASDLGEVGNAEDLVGGGNGFEAAADAVGGTATDACIHFIEDEGALAGLSSADEGGGFQGEGDTGEFAAGSNAIEGARLFAEVRGDEEFEGIEAGDGPGGLSEGDTEAGAVHGERGELLFNLLLEFAGGLLTGLGKLLGGLTVGGCGLIEGSLQLGAMGFGVFGCIELLAGSVVEGEDLFDGSAVLALEFFDGDEAGFDVIEAGGVGFEAAEVIAEREGDVIDLGLSGGEGFKEGLHGGVDAGELFEPLAGDAELGEGGSRGIVEGLVGGGGALFEAGDVLQDSFFLFEGIVFAGFGGDAFDLFNLIGPEVGETDAVLFGAIELV